MKIPHCKICNQDGHYAYACWRNPRRGKNLRQKYKQAYQTGRTDKQDKLLNKQTLDRKRLIMELDKYCSLIVRIGESDKYGIATCYSCGRRLPFRSLDNGHYRSRQAIQTRWDFTNCHPQCIECNRLKRGNLEAYRKHLVREIGEEGVKEIETRPPRKISTPELQEMLAEMKKRYETLIEEKKKVLYN